MEELSSIEPLIYREKGLERVAFQIWRVYTAVTVAKKDEKKQQKDIFVCLYVVISHI